jgi:hypothetical protein
MNLNFSMALRQEKWGPIDFIQQDSIGFRIDVVQHLEPIDN